MANFGLQEFSTQESVNFGAYVDWNREAIDLNSSGAFVESTYIDGDNPAKKIVIYVEPSETNISSLEVSDLLTLRLNGETAANKLIKIDPNDLPFTLTGIQLIKLEIKSENGDSGDLLSLLTFH